MVNGSMSLAKRFVPFSDHGQELSTLLNFYLDGESSILGLAIIVSQEIEKEDCALAYFKSLLDCFCRVIPANCPKDYDPAALAKDIQLLMRQMFFVIVYQSEHGSEFETEYTCFSAECPFPLIQEIVSGQSLLDSEESILLLSLERMAEIDPVQLEILGQVQEEGQLKDVLAAANIEFGGAASSRKARKHRSTTYGENIDDGTKQIVVTQVPIKIFPSSDPAELIDAYCRDAALGLTVSSPAETEEMLVDGTVLNTSASMAAKMGEYEVLLTWLKVLSQPDDIILKKISSFEDYEDRMKKLGAKLKHSLSPEDLIKTLASIHPTPKEPTTK